LASIARRHLDFVPFHAQDLFNGVHEKALGRAVEFGHDKHSGFGCDMQIAEMRQIDDRDHLAAQADHTLHPRRHIRGMGDVGHVHDFTDLENIDPKDFFTAGALILTKTEEQDLKAVGTRQARTLVNRSNKDIHAISLAGNVVSIRLVISAAARDYLNFYAMNRLGSGRLSTRKINRFESVVFSGG